MNRPEQHPDSELLDKLRAGLLDGTAEKAGLETHLAGCPECRRRYNWATLATTDNSTIDRRLDRLREQALHAPRSGKRHRHLPLAAAAALALMAVALINLFPEPDNGPSQIADSSIEVPAIYEDLDFYLWLADHKDTADSST